MRLLEGVVFPSGYEAHAATETCPGHSTILTGSHPGRAGVVANRWYDMGVAREDTRVYCSEDPNVEGSSSDVYTVSTNHLLVPTLGDLMQRVNDASQVVAVAGKDRAAVMLGGANADHIYWPGDSGFTTFEGRELPEALARVNETAMQAAVSSREPLPIPQHCTAYNRAIPILRADSPFGNFYVDRSVPEDRRAEVIARAIALISAHPQVYRVYGRDEIMAQSVTNAPPEHWTVLGRVRANFHPDRSGDFIVVLQPRITPIPQPFPGAYVSTHGRTHDDGHRRWFGVKLSWRLRCTRPDLRPT